MLENLDLRLSLDKRMYKMLVPRLSNRLFEMQKASWDARVPVVILFEGWDAAGKGTNIQKLTSPIDPRGFKLYPIRAARTFEKKKPWLWRYWNKIPARGEWAIFDRSWYGRVMVERVEKLVPESEWRRAYRDIVDFERLLSEDNTLIIKFFLHISRSEQKRRFEKMSKDPLTAWHVTSEDWDHHRHYEDWLVAYEEALENTDTEWGPWTIVEATDRRFTRVKVMATIINHCERYLGLPQTPINLAALDEEELEQDGDAGIFEEDEDSENEAESNAGSESPEEEETLTGGVIRDLLEEESPSSQEPAAGTQANPSQQE